MTRFYGKVGYVGEQSETFPGSGIWEDVKMEVRNYRGDVIRDTRDLTQTENVHDDISVGNSISIVADAYAYEHIFNMKYVEWMGSFWKVSGVEVQRPRLILRLGGLYNGPKA